MKPLEPPCYGPRVVARQRLRLCIARQNDELISYCPIFKAEFAGEAANPGTTWMCWATTASWISSSAWLPAATTRCRTASCPRSTALAREWISSDSLGARCGLWSLLQVSLCLGLTCCVLPASGAGRRVHVNIGISDGGQVERFGTHSTECCGCSARPFEGWGQMFIREETLESEAVLGEIFFATIRAILVWHTDTVLCSARRAHLSDTPCYHALH